VTPIVTHNLDLQLGHFAIMTSKRRGDCLVSSIEEVWSKILLYEGSVFRQVKGKEFRYTVKGNTIVPNTTNVIIGRGQLEKALIRMPVRGPGNLSDLRAPSYLFALLTDERICKY
jgi:hypothetical protein